MTQDQKKTFILFLFLLLLSFVIRVIRISQGLWYDEIHTFARFVLLPWPKIFTTMIVPNNHILYTFLAKLSITIFGVKEWSLRLPALIAGGLTPPVCYLLFRRRAGDISAFLAGLFMAVSFWMVWFSQDARGYSAVILFSVLSQVLYTEFIHNFNRRTAVYYIICSVIGCYFYFYNGFVISAQIAFGFFLWATARKERKAVIFTLPALALILSAALYLPVMPDLAKFARAEGSDIAGRWLDLYFLKEVIKMLASTRSLVLGIPAFVIFLIGLVRLGKSWPEICWLYILAAALLIIFTRVMTFFIYPRFLAFEIPFYFLAGAEALGLVEDEVRKYVRRIPRYSIQAALAVIICFFLCFGLAKYYRLGKQGFKQAAEYIQRNYPGKTVLSFGLANQELLYYDPYAVPWPGRTKLYPVDLMGNLVVASHPWSWATYNREMILKFCNLEKTWPSAGYDENAVYLFNCPP